jgi:hypothetical protein
VEIENQWLRYPTIRLFHQQTAGDWDAVIGEVGAALRDQAEGGS